MDTDVYMTVSDLLQMCAQLEAEGMGHYGVGCDQAYCLAKKDDTPDIDNKNQVIHLGLYTDLYS